MSDATWYATLDGSELGPLTVADLKRLVSEGRIAPQTPVRRQGMEAAVPAARIKGLLSVTSAATEVLPPPAPVQTPDLQRADQAEKSARPGPRVAGDRSRTATVATARTARATSPAAPDDDNPFARPQAELAPVTSELIHGTPAGFFIRSAAYLIDVVIIVVAMVAALVAIPGAETQLDSDLTGSVVWLLVFSLYYVIGDGAFAATPGKLCCGLRVVDRDGRRIGFAGSFKRAASRFILGIIPLIALIDVLMVVRESKLAWHDAMSGTYVVRKGGTRVARRGNPSRSTRRTAPRRRP